MQPVLVLLARDMFALERLQVQPGMEYSPYMLVQTPTGMILLQTLGAL